MPRSDCDSYAGVDVTVIDRENHHLFQPLLYQVAMAALSPADIAVPIRSLLVASNVRVIKERGATCRSRQRNASSPMRANYPYDYLLLACGAQHAYFGHEEWEAYAPGLKTLPQATEIRRRVLEAFEAAERETDPKTRDGVISPSSSSAAARQVWSSRAQSAK